MTLPHHCESSITISALPEEVFGHLDDHARLSSHMSKPSWMMGGGQMTTTSDSGGGKQVGSVIRLAGRAMGIELFVEESIVERKPPNRKVWETIGQPKLLLIAQYRMGFDLERRENQTALTVFIDYSIPRKGIGRALGRLFGMRYAKWCTDQMAKDAAGHFDSKGSDIGRAQVSN